MTADDAVVSDVTASHHEVAVADARDRLLLRRAPIDRDEFPEDVVVADHQQRFCAVVEEVLGT